MEENEKKKTFSRKELIVPIVENVPIIFLLRNIEPYLYPQTGAKIFKMAEMRRAKRQFRKMLLTLSPIINRDLTAITHILLVKTSKNCEGTRVSTNLCQKIIFLQRCKDPRICEICFSQCKFAGICLSCATG